MKTVKKTLTSKEIENANQYQKFRNKCKSYLERHGIYHDKFTITSFDAYIAYVTEKFIANYLRDKYKGKICVSKWSDQFNLEHIASIVNNDSNEPEDIERVSSYFYDSFDLYISTPIDVIFVRISIDVKTAITKKSPNNSWDFLYPAIQAQKGGKDAVVLVYYVADDDNDPSTLRELKIVGYLEENEIKRCPVVKKGEKTKHGTTSQIDNYETHVEDYHDIDELFKNISTTK